MVVRPSSVMALIIVQTSSGSIRNVSSLSNVTRRDADLRIDGAANHGPIMIPICWSGRSSNRLACRAEGHRHDVTGGCPVSVSVPAGQLFW
jgi:hypothetical protein